MAHHACVRHKARGQETSMSATSTFVAADGDGYELLMGRWSRQLAQPFLDFTGLGDGDRVLDVGCGTGHLARAAAQDRRPAAVHALDLSAAYIEHAQRIAPDTAIRYEVGDACALPYHAHSFDRVLSMLVLHFVPQSAQAIAEMRRVTRPGGVVAACVWDARGGFVANRLFFDTAAALDPRANERRARNFTRPMTRPGELAQAWRAGGLLDVTETALCIRMEYASFDDYWAPYLGKDGPGAEYVATLNDDERATLKMAVRAAYLDGEADGPRSFAAIAWGVKGVAPA
jgi:SAM-dependent methyltransferase